MFSDEQLEKGTRTDHPQLTERSKRKRHLSHLHGDHAIANPIRPESRTAREPSEYYLTGKRIPEPNHTQ